MTFRKNQSFKARLSMMVNAFPRSITYPYGKPQASLKERASQYAAKHNFCGTRAIFLID